MAKRDTIRLADLWPHEPGNDSTVPSARESPFCRSAQGVLADGPNAVEEMGGLELNILHLLVRFADDAKRLIVSRATLSGLKE